MESERYPLRQVILDDLTSHNKLAFLLLFLIILTALSVVWTTHQTRLLVAEKGKLLQEQHKLENKFVHLQLEENSQSHKSRVEAAAISFGLQKIKKDQEVILVK